MNNKIIDLECIEWTHINLSVDNPNWKYCPFCSKVINLNEKEK